MGNYLYQKELKRLWDHSEDLYRSGNKDSGGYYSKDELGWLSENGITAQEIFDYVEDFCVGGEPDFTTFALVSAVRRWYFIEKMESTPTGNIVDPASYPAKSSEIEGVVWLPRIIEKAKTKLRGELHDDTMYGCGGDRGFLRKRDIHLADFLQKVAENFDDTSVVVKWVVSK